MLDFQLSPSVYQDKPYIWKTYVENMKPHIEKIWGWDSNWQKVDFDKSLDIYETKIIQINLQKIGYIQYKINSDYTYINMIILEAKFQSKGIGESIIKIILDQSPKKCIKLKCFRVNSSAFAFYKRLGFVVTQFDKGFLSLKLSH